MRITNTLFYTNSVAEHQSAMKKMYDVDKQISSGLKIQNSYEDSGVYVDAMRLNYEIATLEQTKETSSKAQTFAQNTDSTMNQFATSLDSFKTKLIQANNASNSTTSLNALANELQAIKDHMVSLGNTSINGQFLFSGTSLLQKPLTSDGKYLGNGENLTAIIGSGVELPYNINGQSLFLGKDGDYNRIISTNVPMYNQAKLHPEVMGESGSSQEVYLKEVDTIRDMVGDSDTTASGKAFFYLSGRKGDGATFNTKIEIDTTSTISDLLESIGETYGNTSTNTVVDVSMNAHGQIELKDLTQGNQLLEMHLVGAIDRNGGTGADVADIDELLASPDVDIITFNQSNFSTLNAASTISSREDIFNEGIYRIGYPMTDGNGEFVTGATTLQSFMGSSVANLDINGTDFAVGNATTVDDLLSQIETQFSVVTRLENGQMIAEDSTHSLNMTMTAEDSAAQPLNAFSIPDGLNYTRRGFEKEGNELLGNISQIINKAPLDTAKQSHIGEFATASTTLLEVAGTNSLDGKQLILNGIHKNNAPFAVQIDLANAGSTFSPDGGTTNYTIFDAVGNATSADRMSYQQLMDIISMATSNTLPSDTDTAPDGIQADEYNTAIATAKNSVEVILDYKGRIAIKDKTASESKIEFNMYDSKTDTYPNDGVVLSFMANDAVAISNPSIDFFKDLDAMIEAVRTGNFRMGSSGDDPRNIGMQNAILQLDHILDHVTKEHTKIGAYSNALGDASSRAEYLSLNVKTVRSEIIDVDIAKAYLEFNQISNSYQAMLSTIAKINSMSLLNYM